MCVREHVCAYEGGESTAPYQQRKLNIDEEGMKNGKTKRSLQGNLSFGCTKMDWTTRESDKIRPIFIQHV